MAGRGGWRGRVGRFTPFLVAALVLFRLLSMAHAMPDAVPASDPRAVSGAPADPRSGGHDHAHGHGAAFDDAGEGRGGYEPAGDHGCHFCRGADLQVPEPGSVPVRMRAPDREPAPLAAAELPVLDPPFLTSLRARAPPPSA